MRYLRSPYQICFALLSLLTFSFGVYYLTMQEISPYHQAFIEVPFQTLPEKVQALLNGLVRVIGLLLICTSLTLWYLVKLVEGNFRKKHLLFLLTPSLPPILLLQYYTIAVGGSAPAWAPFLALCLLLYGCYDMSKRLSQLRN